MTTESDNLQPPDDDLPPHLASPEAFVRWCRENPEGVRQMEMTVRRMELGEFGDLTPAMLAGARQFLVARKQMREAEAHNAAVLAKLQQVRETLAQYQGALPTGRLVSQLEEIEARIGRCEPITEAWEQFRLDYEALQGELTGCVQKRAAMIAMSLDAHERRDPAQFAQNEDAQTLLQAWREGGMRERMLGALPIAERRELEELERQWREHPPGPGK